jgi:uncharacterized phage protein (TIGR01671 family)
MREMKFRVWIKSAEAVVRVTCIDWGAEYIVHKDLSVPDISALDPPEPEVTTEMNDCILMQFIGRYDNNGKEIYEGDILSNKYTGIPAVVQWEGCGFVARGSHGSLMAISGEVTGNIYETPELIEEAKQ